MGCVKYTSEKRKKSHSVKGGLLCSIKSNQPLFYQELQEYFSDELLDILRAKDDGITYKKEYEKSHGNIITYEYFQTEDIEWFEDKKKWAGLKSFAKKLEKENRKKSRKDTILQVC